MAAAKYKAAAMPYIVGCIWHMGRVGFGLAARDPTNMFEKSHLQMTYVLHVTLKPIHLLH